MSLSNINISVIRSNRKTISLEIKPGEVIVRAPLFMKDKEIKSFLQSKNSWIEKHLSSLSEKQKYLDDAKPYTKEEIKEMTEKAKEVIPQRVEYYAEKVGVSYGRITVRCQKTRWGSCSSKGNLNFNCLLVLLPQEVLDSVVVHELCHRKQMNHSSLFYDEINKVFPEYKKCNQWLKENGWRYFSRLS